MKKALPWPLKLGVWLLLLGLTYGLAHVLVERLWPAYGLLLALLPLLVTLLLPLGLMWLRRRRPHASLLEHYALLPLDALLPLIIGPALLVTGPFVFYRFALFQWGISTPATIVEQSIQRDADTTRYVLRCRFQTIAETSHTVPFGVSRAFYERLAPGQTVTIYYLPFLSAWPWTAIVADPYTSEASLVTLFVGAALLPWLWVGGAAWRQREGAERRCREKVQIEGC